MKIAVNSRMYLEKGTGVPNYIAYLYRACLNIDPENQYIFFQPNQLRTIGETKTAPARAGLAGAAWFDTIQAYKLTREFTPDVFHGPSHILPFRRQKGVKYVVTIHDLAFRVLPEQYGWQHRVYYGWQVARSLRMADVIVADSHNTKRDIIRFYQVPAEKIEVVHLGVAEHFFKAAETKLPRVVEEKYFLSITTHPKRKNVLGALKAFAMFANRCDAQYVVVGLMGEPQCQEFLALADELGIRNKVRLFGYADDSQLVSLYQNAEFTLYPSFYEGFGLPVVEAMACGSPVIASNTSSLPEIMPDGEWLVDPYDIAGIADQMRRMLALSVDERSQIGKKNQQHARNFTWEKAAILMIGIFEKLDGNPLNTTSKNMLRTGLLKGTVRHVTNLPKLVFFVRGWPRLLADCLGRRHQPYRLQTYRGAVCELRPGSSDWWIFLEVFVFEIYRRVREALCRSEVIIDIGGNVGYFALYAGSLNPKACVHAFEPFPPNAAQFKKNLLLNKRNQIFLHALAVAKKTGTETLFFTPGDDSGCSLNRQQGQSCSVSAVGINDIFNVCGVIKCDVLKMDCEGSELDLLSAMSPDVLTKIGSIILEYHDQTHVALLQNILKKAGFECEILAKINTLFAFHR